MFGTNNMPAPRSSAIHITLTAGKYNTDVRHITLHPGETIEIGRASRSEAKNLQAATNNALFDCPVVSRQHAELKANDKSLNEEVTIIDKNSMHGTSVNGIRLAPYRPFILQNGDKVKLGDKVTRGIDTHDGVQFIYDRINAQTLNLPTQSTFGGRGFQVPDVSGDESEPASDDDEESVISQPANMTSSAVTTPEQTKMGTQEQPIDLDSAANRDGLASVKRAIDKNAMVKEVIDLDSDDEENKMTEILPAARPQVTVVPDTYAEDFDEEESVCNHNTGLSQILSQEDDNVSMDMESSSDRDSGSENDENDEHEYDSMEHSEQDIFANDSQHGDYLSDSDASDLSNHDFQATPYDEEGEESASEDDEEDGPELMSSKRQASPELGSITEVRKNSLPANSSFGYATDSYSTYAPYAPPLPRPFDPVRSAQAPYPYPNSYGSVTAQPVQPMYTYGLPQYSWTHPPSQATDSYLSSRWDVRPAEYDTQPRPLAAPGRPLDNSSVPAFKPFSPPVQVPAAQAASQPDNMQASSSRISISKIIEEPKTASAPDYYESAQTHTNSVDVPSMAEVAASVAASIRGTKRKSDEISSEGTTEASPAQAEDLLNFLNQDQTLVHAEPPAKKAKVEVRKVEPRPRKNGGKEIVKYAAGAALGSMLGSVIAGGSVFAFLCSPYCEQLINWSLA